MSLITPNEFETALRDWCGGRVSFMGNWRNVDSAGDFNGHGFLHHWTAMSGISVSVDRQLDILRNGHPNLGGPLCHLAPTRGGHLWIVAGPRANCNHAGNGDPDVWQRVLAGEFDGSPAPNQETVDGNSRLYGLEYMFHPDDGPMPDEQVEIGILGECAIAEAHGWGPDITAGSTLDHYEWTNRKIDRDSGRLPERTREGVRVKLRNKQEDDMPTAKEIADAVWSYDVPGKHGDKAKRLLRRSAKAYDAANEIGDVIRKHVSAEVAEQIVAEIGDILADADEDAEGE